MSDSTASLLTFLLGMLLISILIAVHKGVTPESNFASIPGKYLRSNKFATIFFAASIMYVCLSLGTLLTTPIAHSTLAVLQVVKYGCLLVMLAGMRTVKDSGVLQVFLYVLIITCNFALLNHVYRLLVAG